MSFVWRHPSLVAIEVGWRWLFGVPFLGVVWVEAQRVLTRISPESAGLDRLDWQNPWLDSVLLADAFGRYEPSTVAVLRWLLPLAVAAWAVISGLGRTAVLARMGAIEGLGGRPGNGLLRRLPSLIGLQALWMMALIGCCWLWYRAVGWAAGVYITAGAQPNLVAYLCWLIFLSLGMFTLWALVSWTLAAAPLLLVLEGKGGRWAAFQALGRSFRLGRMLSGKLMEVSLVLAIVKIMLIVLDMVFSAAPLPFADEFGPDALHVLYVAIFVGFLIANDYFHVVRLRSFAELWRHYQDEGKGRLIEFAIGQENSAVFPS